MSEERVILLTAEEGERAGALAGQMALAFRGERSAPVIGNALMRLVASVCLAVAGRDSAKAAVLVEAVAQEALVMLKMLEDQENADRPTN